MFNFLEKFIFKRIVKKLVKAFPCLKEKGLKIYEENKEEIIQKVKNTIFEYIKKLADKK